MALRGLSRRLMLLTLATLAVGCGLALAATYRPAIGAVPRPDPGTFDRAEVAKGEGLARIGNCITCHQAAGGAAYAGGVALATPFGTLYSDNITPDVATGIGSWSREAFRRAMHEGVSRDGHHLYPALPYEHFTHVEDGDLDALYAFLMTRPAVAAMPPANRLIPPLGFRPLLAGWKLLFLRKGAWHPDATRSAQWNRGAYLAEGLGHCGGCHAPRNILGAEEKAAGWAGGYADGWYAPAMDAASPARRAWDADRVFAYLRTGLDTNHAAAAGPMGPVSSNLSRAPEADVRAMAVYTASRMVDAPGAKQPDAPIINHSAEAARSQPEGAALFVSACAACHGAGAPMLAAGRPDLSLGSPLHEGDPRDAIQIMLEGLRPPLGPRGPYMPAYADMFNDAQVGALAAYIRARYSDEPAWPDLGHAVAQARKEGGTP